MAKHEPGTIICDVTTVDTHATPYEQLGDRDDRMLAACRAVAGDVFGQMGPVAGAQDWSDAARLALGGLLSVLRDDPGALRVLFVDGLAGGGGIRAERKRVAAEFERLVQAFLDSPPKGGNALDIPATAVMGALRNITAGHLRTHDEDRLALLIDDGLAWVESYAIPAGQARWSTGAHALLAAAPSLPARWVARSQHERILDATAEVMKAKGYARATVAGILAQAGVSREVFYEHFSDKQHAFLEAQQHPTQYFLDACSAAYFSAQQWPERIWKGLRTMLGLIAANPALSHLRLVECYRAGPAAIRRAEEITRSFTFFLEEGYSYRPAAHQLPRLSSDAIAGAIFEVIQRAVAHGDAAQLTRQLPQIAYIAITPFTGHEQAVDLLERYSARIGPRQAQGPLR